MEGKIAVVTGASRGIGKAIAVKLASKGATVVINYNGSRERAEEVKNEVESAGGKAVIIQCNVADFDACKEFIETVIKEQGRIDILVNNAGITKDGLLMKMSEEDFDKVLDTNLKGTFHTIRAALRQMIRQRSGRIINMASVVGVSGNAGQANYAASKAYPLSAADCGYTEGEQIAVDELRFTAWHTPGHTPGSVVLLCGEHLFCGDTLFAGSIGRTDLEGGSSAQMADSLRKLAQLPIPRETQVLPGHGEFSTFGAELDNNYYIRSALRGGNDIF